MGRSVDQAAAGRSVIDSAVAALATIPAWTEPAARLVDVADPETVAATPISVLMKGNAAVAALSGWRCAPRRLERWIFAGKVVRAQLSERQLLEVVSDFWENHFSVFSGKMPSREALIVWDRDVLRPRALGKFRDLLGAVAHSPAMLFYLDNHLSKKNGLNENYARELLELHTLGVDGGYTQHDVIEVARALTGWTIATPQIGRPGAGEHELDLRERALAASIRTLQDIRENGEDGEEVLDILARHPSTAHYISLKLARRLVSDDPPASLVDRAATTFTRTDGDIAEVVRTIVTSREFFSRARVPREGEDAVSARDQRSARARPAGGHDARHRALIAQLPGNVLVPDARGIAEKGGAWMNLGRSSSGSSSRATWRMEIPIHVARPLARLGTTLLVAARPSG
jgi:uncharacterized protein (DUF1800 family)